MRNSQKHIEDVVGYYHNRAAEFTDKFLGFSVEQSLGDIQRYLPVAPSEILDVGAGPGRDAIWLARQGHKVTAVEPAEGLRLYGQQKSVGLDVVWIDDRLPELAVVAARPVRFDFILLSAVWMFLPPDLRRPALQSLGGLLKPQGRIGMTVQKASAERQELKFFTPTEDYAALTESASLHMEACLDVPDSQGRSDTSWQSVVFSKVLSR